MSEEFQEELEAIVNFINEVDSRVDNSDHQIEMLSNDIQNICRSIHDLQYNIEMLTNKINKLSTSHSKKSGMSASGANTRGALPNREVCCFESSSSSGEEY